MTATLQLDLFPPSVARSSDTVDPLVVPRPLSWEEAARRYEQQPPLTPESTRFLEMIASEADKRGVRQSDDKGQVYVDAFVVVMGRQPYINEYLRVVIPALNARLGEEGHNNDYATGVRSTDESDTKWAR